jgi:hypothetical protein
MPPKKLKQTEALLKNSQQNKTIAKLESNVLIKKGKSDINEIYNDELKKVVDLNETVSVSINKPVPKVKIEKPIKEVSNKGKKASGNLSKYREQVKEALELKKKLDNQKQLSYDDDDDDDDDEEIEFKEIKPTLQVIEPVPEPQISIPKQVDRVQPIQLFNLENIHKDIQDLKLKNKEIEDRYLYRKSCIDISNMRRNMSIKF